MPLFKPEDPGARDPEPIYDGPRALPTLAVWLLLAAAILFSALVGHQEDDAPPPADDGPGSSGADYE
jgi:hypothetical protein